MKYVVVAENDDGFRVCVGICETIIEAYGKAYWWLTNGETGDKYYITLPTKCEGEYGEVIEMVEKETGKVFFYTIILEYDEEQDETIYFCDGKAQML